jgi:hypothetical protein
MPLTDEQFRSHLRRRVEADSLSDGERLQLLSAVRVNRSHKRPAGWFAWGATATAAVAVAIAAVLFSNSGLVAPQPSASLGPAAAAPTSTATSPSNPAPTATPVATEHPVVLTAQELSQLVGSPRTGEIVIALTSMSALDVDLKMCPPTDLCTRAVLDDTEDGTLVSAGWRPSVEAPNVTLLEGADGRRWVERIDIPNYRGLFAFRILSDGVEFLGPLASGYGNMERSVADIMAGEHAQPSDMLFAVHGWLVAEGAYSCPAPQEYVEGGRTDLTWYCSGSFVAGGPVRTVRKVNENTTEFISPHGLRVEINAYAEFAPNPDYDDQGPIPREGVYLVRSAGCQVSLVPCPVWSLVGRLDDTQPLPDATPTAPPPDRPFPREIDGQRVLTAEEAISYVAVLDPPREPFLVGGWIGIVLRDCFVPEDFPTTPLLAPCADGLLMYDEPPDRRGALDGTSIRLVDERGIEVVPPSWGPTVVRVHANDPRAADCPIGYREQCERAFVVEEIVWPAGPRSSPSPEPTAALIDLEWSVQSFPSNEAPPSGRITAVGGRLIVTGAEGKDPAAWYSDDRGQTWARAAVEDGDRRSQALGEVAAAGDELISLGSAYLGTNGNDADRRSVIWASHDKGTSWQRLAEDGVPERIETIAATASGFVAAGSANPFTHGLPDPLPPHAAFWISSDGASWELVPDAPDLALAWIYALGERDGQLVAVGTHGARESSRPAVWTSTGGLSWTLKELSPQSGAALDIDIGADGFTAVGTTDGGAVTWTSTDGLTWTEGEITNERGLIPTAVTVGDRGTVVVGHEIATADSTPVYWFIPNGGSARTTDIGVDVGDVAWAGGVFVAVAHNACGPTADCFTGSYLIFGRIVGR